MEKKEYIKPEITVIDVEPQQIICSSPGNVQEYGTNNPDELQNGEFW